jgi:nitrite reductase (NO-forming)
VLAGRANDVAPLLAAGATVVSAEMFLGWRDIRRLRARALPARHAPLVRAYQRAHGAFLHAALLGALLGAGAVKGRWYANVRLAHLHVAVLGWVGVPLLATLVFLGPTLVRARAADGADRHAERLLPWASTGATVAALGLVAGARPVAAAGVATFAVAATVICLDVAKTLARAAAPDPALATALAWLVLASWLDAVLVASGRTRYLDVVGAMVLVGALAPLVISSAGYLWAMSAGPDALARAGRIAATRRWATARAALWQSGTATLVAVALGRALGADVPRALGSAGLSLAGVSGLLALALPAAYRVRLVVRR